MPKNNDARETLTHGLDELFETDRALGAQITQEMPAVVIPKKSTYTRLMEWLRKLFG